MTTRTDPLATATFRLIIENCRQGERQFFRAAASVGDHLLRRVFAGYAWQRVRFAEELKAHLERRGASFPEWPAKSGQPVSDPLEVSCGSEEQVLACCRQAEEEALQNYRAALASGLPAHSHFVLQAQYALVKRAHAHLCSLQSQRPTSCHYAIGQP